MPPQPGVPPQLDMPSQPGMPPQVGVPLQPRVPAMPVPPQPPRRRAGLVVGICAGAGVLVLLLVVGVVAVAAHLRGGGTDGPSATPGAAAPPTGALPRRTTLFGVPPKACPLLSHRALTEIYPGAHGKETDTHTPEVGNDFYGRRCEWENDGSGDFIRFLDADIEVMTGEDALSTVQGTFPTFVKNLPKSVNITTVEGQKTLSGYGDDAHLIYGIDTEGCRSAFMLTRIQNATAEIQYGGCNVDGPMDLSPVATKVTLNGLYTAAHSILVAYVGT